MKKFIFILILALAAIGTRAQEFEYSRPDTKLYIFWEGVDTVSADTITREYPDVLQGAGWKYSYSITADSLTGDQNGGAYLQYSNRYDPEVWINLDSLIFSGAGTYSITNSNATSDNTFMPLKLRLYTVTSDTNATTRLTEAWILLKR